MDKRLNADRQHIQQDFMRLFAQQNDIASQRRTICLRHMSHVLEGELSLRKRGRIALPSLFHDIISGASCWLISRILALPEVQAPEWPCPDGEAGVVIDGTGTICRPNRKETEDE